MPAVSPDLLVLIDELLDLEKKRKGEFRKIVTLSLTQCSSCTGNENMEKWEYPHSCAALFITLLPSPVLLLMSIFTNLVHEEVFFRCESKHQTSPICFSVLCVCCSFAQGFISASDRLHQALTRVVVFEIQKVAAGKAFPGQKPSVIHTVLLEESCVWTEHWHLAPYDGAGGNGTADI